jgi:hypothetical protein
LRSSLSRRSAVRIVVGALAIVSCAIVALPPSGAGMAQPTACRQQGDIHVCQTEGHGSVVNNDVAQARDEALIDARRRALEQVAGVRVDAETITRNHMLFDQIVRTQARGLIQAERVLEEGQTNDGRFRVKIEAWVRGAEAQDRLEALVSELSFIVILPEQNLGRPEAQPLVENEVVSQLVVAGFRVLDHAQVQRVTRRDQITALQRGDEQAARDIGLRFLANLIVIGQATSQPSQKNQGIVSAHARVTARVLEAETGRVVANVSLDEVRGFGTSAEVAGRRALGAAGKPAAEQLVQALDGYFKRKERRIEVRLRGLPSLDEYRWAKAFLEKQRWVSAVAEAGYASDQSVIVITYPEKTLYLASRIGREPRYRLLEFDRNRILVEFKR